MNSGGEETLEELHHESSARRWGLLLVNLGSPSAPDTSPVRSYLREFLWDPRVMDLPALPRFLILNLFILPLRPARSARLYREIWTPEGSPLLVHSERFRKDLEELIHSRTGSEVPVRMAMRYGEPSLKRVLEEFRNMGLERIRILPLYPQYSSATTGTVLQKIYNLAGAFWNVPSIEVVPPFFDHPQFLRSYASVALEQIQGFEGEMGIRFDHFLFSFHGLPERHIHRGDYGNVCLKEGCCDRLGPQNRFCYRAQSFETARRIAAEMGLPPDSWSISFQSRMGRAAWIGPYTDGVIRELPERGVRNLAVLAPSFVADCLETLEELARGERDSFLSRGGETFFYVPAPNSHPLWVEAVYRILGFPEP